MSFLAYKITNRANGKAYVGITTQGLDRRVANHRKSSAKGNQVLYRAIRKHGWDAFEVAVLYEATSLKELVIAERGLIAAHGTFIRSGGYNMTLGGEGTLGIVRSAASVEKLRAKLRGRKQPRDVVERVKAAVALANARPDVKAKRSAGAKALWADPKHRTKVMASHKRRWDRRRSEAAAKRAAMPPPPPKTRKPKTPEHIAKIAAANRGKRCGLKHRLIIAEKARDRFSRMSPAERAAATANARRAKSRQITDGRQPCFDFS